MRVHMSLIAAMLLTTVLASASGCLGRDAREGSDRGSSSGGLFALDRRVPVPAGMPLTVRLTSTLSSEHARAGDPWTGLVVSAVTVGDRVIVPAGSPVEGVVIASREAERGNRAMLELAVERISLDGETRDLKASTAPVVAGSPRARNLAAIAGGAAAGALLGKAVGGDGKDAAVGGLLGGAAATGAVAASKGYQVVLKSGTAMVFTVDRRS